MHCCYIVVMLLCIVVYCCVLLCIVVCCSVLLCIVVYICYIVVYCCVPHSCPLLLVTLLTDLSSPSPTPIQFILHTVGGPKEF